MRNEARERGNEIREEEGGANKKSLRNWRPRWKRERRGATDRKKSREHSNVRKRERMR